MSDMDNVLTRFLRDSKGLPAQEPKKCGRQMIPYGKMLQMKGLAEKRLHVKKIATNLSGARGEALLILTGKKDGKRYAGKKKIDRFKESKELGLRFDPCGIAYRLFSWHGIEYGDSIESDSVHPLNTYGIRNCHVNDGRALWFRILINQCHKIRSQMKKQDPLSMGEFDSWADLAVRRYAKMAKSFDRMPEEKITTEYAFESLLKQAGYAGVFSDFDRFAFYCLYRIKSYSKTKLKPIEIFCAWYFSRLNGAKDPVVSGRVVNHDMALDMIVKKFQEEASGYGFKSGEVIDCRYRNEESIVFYSGFRRQY